MMQLTPKTPVRALSLATALALSACAMLPPVPGPGPEQPAVSEAGGGAPGSSQALERAEAQRMQAALAQGRGIEAVSAEMAAERAAGPGAQRTQLRAQLLAGLRAAHARGVRLEPQTASDPVVRGWLELGAIAPGAASLGGEGELARWRARHPDHPALEVLAQGFMAPLTAPRPGMRVALLLPLSGPAASQASTVRDGFFSAYYQLPAPARPDVRIYDTGTGTVADALAQAHAGGADFIVGPLLREEVTAAATYGASGTPVLALNFLPGNQAGPANFYQFALSPEEEARMAAQRVLADGRRQGIAIAPQGEWGSRVMDAFARALTAGGGSLLATTTYDPAEYDYADQLRAMLRISDSEARHQRLQSILGTKLDFEPRHRADIGFVFIVPATAVNARLIDVELKAAYAGDIPGYSVSNAYQPDATGSNRDGAGLMYPDMPWMIDGDDDAMRSSIQQAWGNRTGWNSRLFAFGYDACQLMLALSAPQRAPVQIDGLTGQLRLDPDRRVQRDLIWVQIDRDGQPQAMPDDAAAAATGAPPPR